MSRITTKTRGAVFVVDDDASVRRGISNLLRSVGYDVNTYDSSRDFLDHYDEAPGCMILDLNMPGSNGLDLQEELEARDYHFPIIFLSGCGTVSSSVAALKKGAVDFLEKPVDEQVLLSTVKAALKQERDNRQLDNEIADARGRVESLTAREFQVFQHVISGELNKQIAYALEISEKTVKVHRARVMEKMAVHSVAELVRVSEKAGVTAIDPGSRLSA